MIMKKNLIKEASPFLGLSAGVQHYGSTELAAYHFGKAPGKKDP